MYLKGPQKWPSEIPLGSPKDDEESAHKHISSQFSIAKCWEYFQDAFLLISQDQ